MMAAANESGAPPADYDFDFNLPHGVDIDDYPVDGTVDQFNAASPHSNSATYEMNQDNLGQEDFDNNEIDDTLLADTLGPRLYHADPVNQVEGDAGQVMSYDRLLEGISEDEDAGEAFDRSWSRRQATKPVPKPKLSPRRKHDGDTEDVIPRMKRLRKSLFGGPTEEDEVEDHDDEKSSDVVAGPGIGVRMSSLSLAPQDRERSPSDRPFNIGFDLPDSERGDISPRSSPALSDCPVVISPDNQPVYELRQNIDRKKAFTYIDTDMSGNFDPSDEAKQRMLRLNKAKAVKHTQPKPAKGKQRAPKEHVMKLIVRLRFRAFGNVRNYTNDEQNWPDDWSEIDSECERERQECRAFFRPITPDRSLQRPIDDPADEVDDLTGYPKARGCKACRINKQECSMVTNGEWPCTQCADEDEDCEPIVAAKKKGTCKQCVEDGVDVCSFEYEPEHAICDRCTESEFVCEPLPPEGYRADRINIDELVYGENRPYAACTFCRQEKKKCSLKKKTDKPPCKYCKKNHISCTFFDLPKKEPAKKTAAARPLGPTEGEAPEVEMPGSSYFTAEDLADMERGYEETSSRESTPDIEMEDNAGNVGQLTKIMTSFAHPIQFQAPTEDVSDCNFCEMPMFGMVGHLEREVHVIRWHNGQGYTEVGGGYCEDNGPTKMCGTCTVNRIQIMVCEDHKFECAFDGEDTPDIDTVTEDLCSAEPGSDEMQYELQRWCSMCFTVARFGCATPQISMDGAEEGMEKTVKGCGLRLCDRCRGRLDDEFGGDVELLAYDMDMAPKVTAEDEQSDSIEGRARADVGFLRKEGLLMAAVAAEE